MDPYNYPGRGNVHDDPFASLYQGNPPSAVDMNQRIISGLTQASGLHEAAVGDDPDDFGDFASATSSVNQRPFTPSMNQTSSDEDNDDFGDFEDAQEFCVPGSYHQGEKPPRPPQTNSQNPATSSWVQKQQSHPQKQQRHQPQYNDSSHDMTMNLGYPINNMGAYSGTIPSQQHRQQYQQQHQQQTQTQMPVLTHQTTGPPAGNVVPGSEFGSLVYANFSGQQTNATGGDNAWNAMGSQPYTSNPATSASNQSSAYVSSNPQYGAYNNYSNQQQHPSGSVPYQTGSGNAYHGPGPHIQHPQQVFVGSQSLPASESDPFEAVTRGIAYLGGMPQQQPSYHVHNAGGGPINLVESTATATTTEQPSLRQSFPPSMVMGSPDPRMSMVSTLSIDDDDVFAGLQPASTDWTPAAKLPNLPGGMISVEEEEQTQQEAEQESDGFGDFNEADLPPSAVKVDPPASSLSTVSLLDAGFGQAGMVPNQISSNFEDNAELLPSQQTGAGNDVHDFAPPVPSARDNRPPSMVTGYSDLRMSTVSALSIDCDDDDVFAGLGPAQTDWAPAVTLPVISAGVSEEEEDDDGFGDFNDAENAPESVDHPVVLSDLMSVSLIGDDLSKVEAAPASLAGNEGFQPASTVPEIETVADGDDFGDFNDVENTPTSVEPVGDDSSKAEAAPTNLAGNEGFQFVSRVPEIETVDDSDDEGVVDEKLASVTQTNEDIFMVSADELSPKNEFNSTSANFTDKSLSGEQTAEKESDAIETIRCALPVVGDDEDDFGQCKADHFGSKSDVTASRVVANSPEDEGFPSIYGVALQSQSEFSKITPPETTNADGGLGLVFKSALTIPQSALDVDYDDPFADLVTPSLPLPQLGVFGMMCQAPSDNQQNIASGESNMGAMLIGESEQKTDQIPGDYNDEDFGDFGAAGLVAGAADTKPVDGMETDCGFGEPRSVSEASVSDVFESTKGFENFGETGKVDHALDDEFGDFGQIGGTNPVLHEDAACPESDFDAFQFESTNAGTTLDDDDFGDFATTLLDTRSTEKPIGHDEEDFGVFGSVQVDNGASRELVAQGDDFGDFESVQIDHGMVALPEAQEGGDDFGAFGSPQTSSGPIDQPGGQGTGIANGSDLGGFVSLTSGDDIGTAAKVDEAVFKPIPSCENDTGDLDDDFGDFGSGNPNNVSVEMPLDEDIVTASELFEGAIEGVSRQNPDNQSNACYDGFGGFGSGNPNDQPVPLDDDFGDFGTAAKVDEGASSQKLDYQNSNDSGGFGASQAYTESPGGRTEQKEEAFGDFGSVESAGGPEIQPAQHTGMNPGDDFGDFGSGQAVDEETVQSKAAERSSDPDEDDFGDFDSSPVPRNAHENGISVPEDDFGDFGSADTGGGNQTEKAAQRSSPDEDDFGDFDSHPSAKAGNAIQNTEETTGEEGFRDFGSPERDTDAGEKSRSGDFDSLPGSKAGCAIENAEDSTDEDGFGDFGSAEEDTKAGGKSRSSSDEGDFGGVDSHPVAKAGKAIQNADSEDDFGDFGSAEQDTKADEKCRSSPDEDDFGDFDSHPGANAGNAIQNAEDSTGEDDFGGFGSAEQNTKAGENPPPAKTDVSDDDEDDFGDFGTAGPSSMESASAKPGSADDEDFGDFGSTSLDENVQHDPSRDMAPTMVGSRAFVPVERSSAFETAQLSFERLFGHSLKDSSTVKDNGDTKESEEELVSIKAYMESLGKKEVEQVSTNSRGVMDILLQISRPPASEDKSIFCAERDPDPFSYTGFRSKDLLSPGQAQQQSSDKQQQLPDILDVKLTTPESIPHRVFREPQATVIALTPL